MDNKKRKKVDFKKKKDKTLNSLFEVECFLNRTCKLHNATQIWKIFKKN